MPNYITMIFAAAIAGLLLIGKDAPLRAAIGKLIEVAKKRLDSRPGPIAYVTVDAPPPPLPETRLPAWITEPNDLQLMLLHLAHHAMLRGDINLKDQTIRLMRPFADLHLKPSETGSPDADHHDENKAEVAK